MCRAWRVCGDRRLGGDRLSEGAQSNLDDVAGDQLFPLKGSSIVDSSGADKMTCGNVTVEHHQRGGAVHIHWGLHNGEGLKEK